MISDIWKVAGAAVEYGGATKALVASLKRGESLEAGLRAFAAETESEIDDQIVDGAIDAIEEIADAARMVAARALTVSLLLHRLSTEVEERTPEARGKVEDFSRLAAELARVLDGLTIRDDA